MNDHDFHPSNSLLSSLSRFLRNSVDVLITTGIRLSITMDKLSLLPIRNVEKSEALKKGGEPWMTEESEARHQDTDDEDESVTVDSEEVCTIGETKARYKCTTLDAGCIST